MLRCGKWEVECVRLCGSGSPQSTTAKRGHFVGYHGEGVLQCKPPNLAAELGRRWMFAISAGHCNGERFGGRCVSLRAVGKGEGVTRSVPPNLRALRKFLQKLSKVTNYGIMQISILLRARFAFLISSHQAKTQPNGWAIAWWEEVDSNHRSRRQQIYSLLPLATRESSHGAGERNRTINLLITNQLLCLLSYTSISGAPA